jgi:hypothetical protein
VRTPRSFSAPAMPSRLVVPSLRSFSTTGNTFWAKSSAALRFAAAPFSEASC